MLEGTITIKTTYNSLMVFFATIFTWLGIDSEVFFIFSILLFLDYVSGIGKAKRLGHQITSIRMKYGIISKLSLIIIPLVLALAAKGVKIDSQDILYVGMNILILSELYSIIGNIYAIRTGEELPEYDVVASLGKKIRDTLIRIDGSKGR